MTAEVNVDEEELKKLRENIECNGRTISDPKFISLIDYLKLNPPIEGSLDPQAKPVFTVLKRGE